MVKRKTRKESHEKKGGSVCRTFNNNCSSLRYNVYLIQLPKNVANKL